MSRNTISGRQNQGPGGENTVTLFTGHHEQILDAITRLTNEQEGIRDDIKALTDETNKLKKQTAELQRGQNNITDHITRFWENVKVGSGDTKRILSYHPVREPIPDGKANAAEPQELHIRVYERNIQQARILLNAGDRENLLQAQVNNSRYEKTRMMGEIPLFIAALSFDNEMVDMLIRKGAKVSAIVSGGNTVFHLLVRYADLYPEHQTYVQNMMERLNKALQNKGMMLWYTTNNDGQTALQLAALLEQHELFKWMLELEVVYKKHEKIYNHIDCVRFNINEIDYVALNHFRGPRNLNCFCRNVIFPAPIPPRVQSVIEIICENMESDKAYQFINIPPIDDIIDKKLKHYKWRLIIWSIIHLSIMALLAGLAVVKALLINDSHQLMSTNQATTFVYFVSIILFVFGIMYLVMESFGIYNRCVFLDKRNWNYHALMFVFSLCLMAASIGSWIPGPQSIYLLAIALVVGGWFLPFFLRPWERFSVFTAIVRGVLLGDSLRFVLIILFDFVAFSFAMYVLYLPTPGGPPTEFEHLGMTFLTMFTLMLGLIDLEILTRAPFPWLTVTLFIIFVVLTYVLMFNILIAIMTKTSEEMTKNREMEWKLQRLALVVMIEHVMPLCCALNTGTWDEDNQRFFSTRYLCGNQIYN